MCTDADVHTDGLSPPGRSWFALTEDLVHQWVREPAVRREGLLALLTDLLVRLLRYPARDWGARSPASPAGGCSRPTTSEALAPVASIDFFTVAP